VETSKLSQVITLVTFIQWVPSSVLGYDIIIFDNFMVFLFHSMHMPVQYLKP